MRIAPVESSLEKCSPVQKGSSQESKQKDNYCIVLNIPFDEEPKSSIFQNLITNEMKQGKDDSKLESNATENIKKEPVDDTDENDLVSTFNSQLKIKGEVKKEKDDEDDEETTKEYSDDELIVKGPEYHRVVKGAKDITAPYNIPVSSYRRQDSQESKYISPLRSLISPQSYTLKPATQSEQSVPNWTDLNPTLVSRLDDNVLRLYSYDCTSFKEISTAGCSARREQIKRDEKEPNTNVGSPQLSDLGYETDIETSPSPAPSLISQTSPPYDPPYAPYPSPIHTMSPQMPSPPSVLLNKPKMVVHQYCPNIICPPRPIQQTVQLMPPENFQQSYVRPIYPTLQVIGRAIQEAPMRQQSEIRIQKLMNNQLKNCRWVVLCKKSDVYSVDSHGQTDLMKILRQPPRSTGFFESLYVLIKRIEKDRKIEYLLQRNVNNESALYIAATELSEIPLIARYIADAIAHLKHDPDEIYGSRDNSLLHILTEMGENYAEVIAEFLNSESTDGKLFNVNRQNSEGQTPLHLAILTNSMTIAKLFIDHGADLTIQNAEGYTPLHLSIKVPFCNQHMVKVLLEPSFMKDYVNLTDSHRNTPLHFAAQRNDIPMNVQEAIIDLLIKSRARHNLRNDEGKVALSLVDQSRKDSIRRILNKQTPRT